MKGMIIIMNKRNILVTISVIILVPLLATAAYIYYVPDPLNTVDRYIAAWQESEYKNIHSLLTEESQDVVTIDEIQAVYGNFLNQAGLEKIEVFDISQLDGEFSQVEFRIKARIESRYFNDQELNYLLHLKREGLVNWKLVWDYQLVYPGLKEGDTFNRERSLAQRGEIYDSKEKPLAVKGDVITVGVHPNRIEDRGALVSRLSELLDLDEDYVDREIDRYSNNPDWLVPIKRLTNTNYRLLEGELRPIPGVVFSRSSGRIYPFAELAAHTIGYMGEVDQNWIDSYPEKDYRVGEKVGKSGLERAYEFELRGEPGYTLYLQRDTSNQNINESNDGNKNEESNDQDGVKRDIDIEKLVVMNSLPVPGDDIYLTLDMDYQQEVYQALADGERVGSIILMDPNSGDLLALVNFPSYDPNGFSLGMTTREWESLRTDQRNPMLNRALQGLYPPGSILKLLTVSAALDSGLLESDTIFNDTGEYRVLGNVISNFQKEVFGEHQLADAIIHSINTTMAKVGVKLGEEEFRKYGEGFSFNREREFDLSVKESSLGSLRTPVDLAWSAVGQAEVVVTPLQMVAFTAIIAAGGRDVQPAIVDKRIDYQADGSIRETIDNEQTAAEDSSTDDTTEDRYRVIKKETAEIVTELMVSVVDQGTGKKAGIPGIKIAGKTGTAEMSSVDEMTHAWFTSFAPAEKPELALLIFLERGGVGGQEAAPVARELWSIFLDVQEEDFVNE